MRTMILLVLALGLVAIAVPAPVAEAHTQYCWFGESCTVKCLVHEYWPVTEEHDCQWVWDP
jgi:hypothetical protein